MLRNCTVYLAFIVAFASLNLRASQDSSAIRYSLGLSVFAQQYDVKKMSDWQELIGYPTLRSWQSPIVDVELRARTRSISLSLKLGLGLSDVFQNQDYNRVNSSDALRSYTRMSRIVFQHFGTLELDYNLVLSESTLIVRPGIQCSLNRVEVDLATIRNFQTDYEVQSASISKRSLSFAPVLNIDFPSIGRVIGIESSNDAVYAGVFVAYNFWSPSSSSDWDVDQRSADLVFPVYKNDDVLLKGIMFGFSLAVNL